MIPPLNPTTPKPVYGGKSGFALTANYENGTGGSRWAGCVPLVASEGPRGGVRWGKEGEGVVRVKVDF